MYSASRTTSPLVRGTLDAHAAAAMAPGTRSGAIPQQVSALQPAFRSPRRVTITLPFSTFEELQGRADGEGRSLSNLAAFLLESSLKGPAAAPVAPVTAGHLRRSQESPFR
jgi:hypothetical protein